MHSKLMPLIVVESDGLLKGDCVVVGGGTSETREIGLLVSNPGDPLESICPVKLVYDNSLSELIAMGPSTAARCGIVSEDSSDWELRTKGFIIQAISRLELELAADLSSNPETSARFCGSNIDGQLFYLPI